MAKRRSGSVGAARIENRAARATGNDAAVAIGLYIQIDRVANSMKPGTGTRTIVRQRAVN